MKGNFSCLGLESCHELCDEYEGICTEINARVMLLCPHLFDIDRVARQRQGDNVSVGCDSDQKLRIKSGGEVLRGGINIQVLFCLMKCEVHASRTDPTPTDQP